MKSLLYIASLVLCVSSLMAQGTLTGTIRYAGVVPPGQRILLTDGQTLVHHDLIVHPKSKGLRDVIVMLDWKEKVPADKKAMPIVIDQRDMLFLPRVVTVQEGRKVRFENNDLYNHAVNAVSVEPHNNFNVSTPANQPYEHTFKAQKNPVQIGCVLHPWMRAWIAIVPHPYHAVTNSDGAFRIERVPPGKHTLLLSHPDTGYRESVTVEVQAGKTANVAVEWKAINK